MTNDCIPVPKLKVGCLWLPRPQRDLSSLRAESHIPIIQVVNYRHFTLLAKYRPRISFFKSPTPWDWITFKAKERCEQNQLDSASSTKICSTQFLQRESTILEESVSLSSETVANLPLRSSHINGKASEPLLKPSSGGWPLLHTARRCLTRQRPRGKVSNEEMYASLRKPPAVDILGPKWQLQHKKTQKQLLRKVSARSQLLPLEKELFTCGSRVSSARSMTNSVTSSNKIRSSLHSLPSAAGLHQKPSNVVTYTPLTKEPPKDTLAPDWKEHHKRRQEHLLQQKHCRERKEDVIVSARSVAEAAITVLRQPSKEDSIAKINSSISNTQSAAVCAVQSQASVARTFVVSSKTPRQHSIKTKTKPKRPPAPLLEPPECSLVPKKTDEKHEQCLEAQIGIMKDWLRTHLPVQMNSDRNALAQLQDQMTSLNAKHGELQSLIDGLQRKTHADIADHFATFAKTLRADIFAMMKEDRTKKSVKSVADDVENHEPKKPRTCTAIAPVEKPSKVSAASSQSKAKVKHTFWVPETAMSKPPLNSQLQKSEHEDLITPKVLKVRTIRPFNTTLASRQETTRLSRQANVQCHESSQHRSRSPSVTAGSSASSEDDIYLDSRHKGCKTGLHQSKTNALSPKIKPALTQHNLVSNYHSLPSAPSARAILKDSATSPHRLSFEKSSAALPGLNETGYVKKQVDIATQFPDQQDKNHRKTLKLFSHLVKALANSDRRLAKSRQANLLLRSIIEQSTVRIGMSVDSLHRIKCPDSFCLQNRSSPFQAIPARTTDVGSNCRNSNMIIPRQSISRPIISV